MQKRLDKDGRDVTDLPGLWNESDVNVVNIDAMYGLLSSIKHDLRRAEEQRSEIRKRVNVGVSHEIHLAYADGLVAGLESAKLLAETALKATI